MTREINDRVRGTIDSVYIGGGTPSVLPRGALTRIFDALRQNAVLDDDCEMTVEANPDSCTGEFIKEAADCGVNRISLGVQTLNDEILTAIGRRHDSSTALKAVREAHNGGIKNVSCDLMLGLPGQTLYDVSYAADTLCDLGIKHISVYSLNVEEGTRMYKSGYRVDDDVAADMYEAAYAKMKERGFVRYEVSNFALDGYRSRHNGKYWKREPYIGIGAAAHSFCGDTRSYNTFDIDGYISGDRGARSEKLSAADRLEEYIMLGLRTVDGVEFGTLDLLSGSDWRSGKREVLVSLSDKGLIDIGERGFALSEKAYYVMNEIIVRLI